MRGRRRGEGGWLEELVPEGAISGGAPFRLYYLVAGSRSSGLLTLQDPNGVRWELYFRSGVPHLVRSSSPNLGLGRYLLAQQILSGEQLARAQATMQEHGGELVDVLARCGDLEYADVYRILAGYSRALLIRALSVSGGRFQWDPAVPPPVGSQPLGERWELLCEAGRRLGPETVLERLGPWVNVPVGKGLDELVALDTMGLNAQELRLVAALDGSRSLAQLAAAAPHETERIYRTGYLLLELGKLAFREEAPGVSPGAQAQPRATQPFDPAFTPAPSRAIRASAIAGIIDDTLAQEPPPSQPAPQRTPLPPPATPRPASPRGQQPMPSPAVSRGPGPASPGPRSRGPQQTPVPPPAVPRGPGAVSPGPMSRGPQRTPVPPPAVKPAQGNRPGAGPGARSESAALLEGLGSMDHFEVLGIERTATATEVKQAYFRLARTHHPDTAIPGDPKDRRAKEQITARLNEAYAVLGSDSSRISYLSDLEVTGGPQDVDIANLLEAEKLFRRATLLVKARQFREAVAELDAAIELNDAEGEFYAWRAFARFSSTADKRQVEQETLAELHTAMEKSPNAAITYLLAGRVTSVLGDVSAAIKYYQRCLALEAGNVEARRELRLLESRRAK